MTLLSFVGVGGWALQSIFAIVVLALSAQLMNGQKIGSPPATTVYSVFTGASGLIVAAFGLVAMFVEAVPTLLVLVVGSISCILFLAAGIAFSVELSGVGCNRSDIDGWRGLTQNKLLNEGSEEHPTTGNTIYGFEDESDLKDNCNHARATQGMQFGTFIVAALTLVIMLLIWKDRRVGGGRRTIA